VEISPRETFFSKMGSSSLCINRCIQPFYYFINEFYKLFTLVACHLNWLYKSRATIYMQLHPKSMAGRSSSGWRNCSPVLFSFLLSDIFYQLYEKVCNIPKL
jgi:hypothetical protein